MENYNLKKEAFPCSIPSNDDYRPGLSKHEYAAIMIAQGLVAKYNLKEPSDEKIIAKMAYELSAEVLNQFK
jgi:hypothetical protein